MLDEKKASGDSDPGLQGRGGDKSGRRPLRNEAAICVMRKPYKSSFFTNDKIRK